MCPVDSAVSDRFPAPLCLHPQSAKSIGAALLRSCGDKWSAIVDSGALVRRLSWAWTSPSRRVFALGNELEQLLHNRPEVLPGVSAAVIAVTRFSVSSGGLSIQFFPNCGELNATYPGGVVKKGLSSGIVSGRLQSFGKHAVSDDVRCEANVRQDGAKEHRLREPARVSHPT